MNLDRLKKLVMLANHNPSDHEANRAARLVCKMIEEAEFNFISDNGQPKNVPLRGRPTPSTPMHPNVRDWVKTWYDEQAKEQAHARSYDYDDYFKNSPFSSKQRENWVNGEWNFRPNKPKRALKCKTCGYTHETVFQGLPELFECNPCQWTAYQKSQQK